MLHQRLMAIAVQPRLKMIRKFCKKKKKTKIKYNVICNYYIRKQKPKIYV
jgi:hypothetical protein